MTPGIHTIPEREYHRRILGVASKSGLDRLAKSPLQYKTWIEGPSWDPTPAMALGTALHMAVLEPSSFEKAYAVEPDFGDCRFKENKSKRDAWRDDNAGRRFLGWDDGIAILGMRDSLRRHPLIGHHLESAKAEQSLYWVDTETGIQCKARVDLWLPKLRLALDVKTTEDASLRGFTRSVASYRYDRQADFYEHGFAAVGEPVEHFVFLAVEKSPPYECALFTVDQEFLMWVHEETRRLMRTLAECVTFGRWPGYPERIQNVKVPGWAKEDA